MLHIDFDCFGKAPPAHHKRLTTALHTYVDFHRSVEQIMSMNAKELQRQLAKLGCTFENHRGGSGHLTIKLGDKKSQLPMHGGSKELGPALVTRIMKQLGLK